MTKIKISRKPCPTCGVDIIEYNKMQADNKRYYEALEEIEIDCNPCECDIGRCDCDRSGYSRLQRIAREARKEEVVEKGPN